MTVVIILLFSPDISLMSLVLWSSLICVKCLSRPSSLCDKDDSTADDSGRIFVCPLFRSNRKRHTKLMMTLQWLRLWHSCHLKGCSFFFIFFLMSLKQKHAFCCLTVSLVTVCKGACQCNFISWLTVFFLSETELLHVSVLCKDVGKMVVK